MRQCIHIFIGNIHFYLEEKILHLGNAIGEIIKIKVNNSKDLQFIIVYNLFHQSASVTFHNDPHCTLINDSSDFQLIES